MEDRTTQSAPQDGIGFYPGRIRFAVDPAGASLYRQLFESPSEKDARIRKEAQAKQDQIEREVVEFAIKEAGNLAQLVANFHNVLTNHMSNQAWVTGPGDKTEFVRELTREYFRYLLDEELDDE